MLEEEKVVTEEVKAEAAPATEAPKEEKAAPRGDRRPHGDRKGGKGDRRDRKPAREVKDDMEERVVFINRVSKPLKVDVV